MMDQWIEWSYRIVVLLGVLGGVYVLKTLKTTVEAQEKTIAALRSLLEAADVPKMAERFKAYQEIVDHEKDAVTKKLAAEFDREKEALTAGSRANVELGQALMKSLVDFGSSIWPYIPMEARAVHIDLIKLPPTHQA